MGSKLLKKGEVSQSTQNRMMYSYMGLWVFRMMEKANTNAKGLHYKTKKKISRIDLCRYMAEHNKPFRAIWLKTHPNKHYPKMGYGRTALGESFYRSNVADQRRFVRREDFEKEMRALWKKSTTFTYFDRGKIKKSKY